MDFSTDCIASELERFDQCFERLLHSRVALTNEVVRYYLNRKGKRLRPMVALLVAKMLRDQVSDRAINGALALELLHNASLLHDDVIDKSDERRGAPTVNKVWDNRIAVLVGDFFLAKSLEASNASESLEISRILSDLVIRLSEGEIEQMCNARAHISNEDAYFSVISNKTASLFSACMRIGACGSEATEEVINKLSELGELMGLVFQIRDDIFDYFPSNNEIGKPTGHDIMEGKVTLPLLYALNKTNDEETARMKALLDQEGDLDEDAIVQLVEFAKAQGGIEYAQTRMDEIASRAKNLLLTFPDNPARQSLFGLIDYFISRNK